MLWGAKYMTCFCLSFIFLSFFHFIRHIRKNILPMSKISSRHAPTRFASRPAHMDSTAIHVMRHSPHAKKKKEMHPQASLQYISFFFYARVLIANAQKDTRMTVRVSLKIHLLSHFVYRLCKTGYFSRRSIFVIYSLRSCLINSRCSFY